jgi:hypothetical protein
MAPPSCITRGIRRSARSGHRDSGPSFDVPCARGDKRSTGSRPADGARVWRKWIGAAAVAVLAFSVAASPVGACSGAPVSFEQIRTGATRIVVASVVEVESIDKITLEVHSVLRGMSGRELVLEPPTYMGCDGRMQEPVGARLIVATGPHFFADSPAQEMHPYWRIEPGDIVVPAGVDDPNPDHTRLAGLIAEFGGFPVPPVEPEALVEQGPGPGVLLVTAIVVAMMLAVVALFGALIVVARKGRQR